MQPLTRVLAVGVTLVLLMTASSALSFADWFKDIQKKDLKVYVYELPERFDTMKCTHSFTCLFTIRVKGSRYYTTDGNAADMYYIPSRGSFENQTLLLDMFQWIRTAHPWWNKWKDARPVRHFMLMQNDHGPSDATFVGPLMFPSVTGCPDDVNPASPNRSVAFIEWNGQRDGPDYDPAYRCSTCFQHGKDIMMPTGENICGPLCGYKRSTLMERSMWGRNSKLRQKEFSRPRKYTMLYGGVMPYPEKDDYTGRGPVYQYYKDRQDYLISRRDSPQKPPKIDFSLEMQEADFCYSPLGQHGGDPDRYVAGIMFGCLPVMPSSTHHKPVNKSYIPQALPLEELLPWPEFGTIIDFQHVKLLDEQLKCLKPNVPKMRQALEQMWPHFLWTSVYGSYLGEGNDTDAFESIMAIFKLRMTGHTTPKAMLERNKVFPCREAGLPKPLPY